MKKNVWIIIAVLSLLVSSCGSAGTPTVEPVDVQNTAVAAAFTMVAETQAAIPTATPLPPTEAPTLTPLPTETPQSSPTLDPSVASPTNIPTFTPSASTSSSTGGGDPCNQPLTKWEGPSASLTVVNETKPQGDVVLSLYVVTELGECGYLYVYSDSLSGPVGQYSAGAFVNGKKNFKVFGGFRITEGAWRIVVRNESIVALGGCYPNC
jgi:hypothetical protein